MTALARGQASVGAGVVIGSNVFNLAALLGLAAVVAGRIRFHRRVVLLGGIPGIWVALVCLLRDRRRAAASRRAGAGRGGAGPRDRGAGARRARRDACAAGPRGRRWLAAAVHEEEDELAQAIRPAPGHPAGRPGRGRGAGRGRGGEHAMELAATALGSRYAVPDIVTGALVLAVVTSLPNAVSAVYLACAAAARRC